MWHTDSRFQILKMEDGLITHDDGGFRPENACFRYETSPDDPPLAMPARNTYRNQSRSSRGLRKMLKHIGIPIAIASITAIVALAWTMILSPAQAVAQSAQEARAYITVEIRTGDDSVSWSDPDACSSEYNIYLSVRTPVPGSSTGQTTRTHIGSAASGSTQATLPISNSGGSGLIPPNVKVELYCGEYAADSSQNVLVASTRLASIGPSLSSSTFSSAPLTALSVGSRTLSPSFNRGIGSYSADTKRVCDFTYPFLLQPYAVK